MNGVDEASREIVALRREVETLREELNALKRLLGAAPNEALSERQNPLALRCASLEVLGGKGFAYRRVDGDSRRCKLRTVRA
jgi:hypothetical protein